MYLPESDLSPEIASIRYEMDDDSDEGNDVTSDSNDSDVAVINRKDEKTPAKCDTSKEKEAELTSPKALLNKIEEYVADAIDNRKNIDRKVLDALSGAINVQVQKEPLSVRKLILDKQLVLPNTISFPPSLTVDMLIEYDPDHPLSKVIKRMFGEERPKLNEAEEKERQNLKLHNNVPHMTKLLLDIGYDLVQESTYCDIVHARNLPETPKNIETYEQVAAQLGPVWEALRKRNEPYKLKMLSCQACGFKTESRMILQHHRSTVHFRHGKYQCAMCPEFDTNEQRLINHYLGSHNVVAIKDAPQAKYPCLICDEDFYYKDLRDTHLRTCKKDYSRVRNIMGPKGPEDQLTINRWLWDRPPIDATILQQQQNAQAQQVCILQDNTSASIPRTSANTTLEQDQLYATIPSMAATKSTESEKEQLISQLHSTIMSRAPDALPLFEKLLKFLNTDPLSIVEAEKRARSLVIYGVEEAVNDVAHSKKQQHTEAAVSDILDILEVEARPTEVYRVGTSNSGRPRLIKCVLPSQRFVHKALRNATRLRSSNGHDHIYIRRSMTREERARDRELRAKAREMNLAQHNGAKFYVVYRNEIVRASDIPNTKTSLSKN